MDDSNARPRPARRAPLGLVVAIVVSSVVAVGAGTAVAVGVAAGGGALGPDAGSGVSESIGASASASAIVGAGTGGTVAPEPSAEAAVPASGASVGDSAITALVDPDWARGTAALTGIPFRALLAYAGAERRMEEEQPSCGLRWNTLAAIGQVESEHGTLAGGSIQADGHARPGIVGIALNGQGVEAIPDTDRGALDGDTVWDRAVGPMQFLPSTWALFGADGDGDGVADAQHIDDAALTAARYLCADGSDLTSDGDWIAAVHSYNGTIDYNNRVAAVAETYAAATAAG